MNDAEIVEALADQIEPLERAFSGLQRSESVSRINVASVRNRRVAMRAAAEEESFFDSVFIAATEEKDDLPDLTRSGSVVFDAVEQTDQLIDQKKQLATDIKEMKHTAAVLHARIATMEKRVRQQPNTIYDLLQKIAAAQQETSQTIAWMSDQMLGAHRATQFLVKENALLRSRQTERQDLAREMQMQQRCGLAGSVDALSAQVANIAQQQAAILDALSAFSHSYDMPPPVAFVRHSAEGSYDEVINLMRQGMNDPPPYPEDTAKTENAE